MNNVYIHTHGEAPRRKNVDMLINVYIGKNAIALHD